MNIAPTELGGIDMDGRTTTAGPLKLVACSLCLRVHQDSGWIEAGEAIRRLRTFDRSEVRLEPGICDRCSELIARRRNSDFEEPLDLAA
jgi:hypothetical protein